MQIKCQDQVKNIVIEGLLSKQSRFLKTWRQRWFVLTQNAIMTFKQQKVYKSPTELIPLANIITVRSCDQQIDIANTFKVATIESVFYIKTNSQQQKQKWIGKLGKALIKRNQKNQKQQDHQ